MRCRFTYAIQNSAGIKREEIRNYLSVNLWPVLNRQTLEQAEFENSAQVNLTPVTFVDGGTTDSDP